MTRPPEPHFNLVWWSTAGLIVALALANIINLVAPGTVPRAVIETASVMGLWGFWQVEVAAGGVKAGYSGTMTSWWYWHVTFTPARVFIGLGIGLVMFASFPGHWAFRLIAAGFTLWLPRHYSGQGNTGPIDWLFRWLGRLTGVAE